ncbi:MsnO8 family LLM class oxidoreductase [Paenibacillus humicola]|uniref:MsnO8 family LLM class oxidoreductase n=1 Tax=Paenibacillus humicola TaxID=3110540 RepID=UPI00237A4795|nr:MsnO8 family LLM class oxidoreductase [Paenibacillus humicola]
MTQRKGFAIANGQPLKLGVLDLVPVLNGADTSAALEQAARLAQAAEALGYGRYWAAEHHDMPGLACTAPEVLLAHVGARTRRIRLGSGALLLPHYRPLKVAESFHMLASLYPGRIDLGIGRAPGGTAHVSMAMSGNFLEHVREMPELLRSLTELVGGRYEYEGVPVTARPVPAEPPELWLLGTNARSAGYAAQFGTGYVFGQFMSDAGAEEALAAYRGGFVPSRLCPSPRVMIAVGAVCAETEAEARQLAASAGALFRPEGAGDSAADSTPLPGDSPAGGPAEGRRLLAGRPEDVAAQLRELSRRYGTDEFIVVTMTGDYRKRLRSYKLLAEALWG